MAETGRTVTYHEGKKKPDVAKGGAAVWRKDDGTVHLVVADKHGKKYRIELHKEDD